MVSAIITTHNRADLLKKAIESVKSQTYSDLEIIVVDDASDDNTEKMCRSIKGISYIRISKEESRGGNYARNVGIKNAKGEYVAFLDDDDRWEPRKIEMQVKVLDNNKDIGMVYTGLYVDTEKKGFNYVILFDENARGNLVEKGLFWKPICSTSAMLVRKNILEEIGYFDEKVRYWQEYELTLRLIQRCNVELINEPLVIYRKSLKDKKQLTNNYDKWEESVKYINEKHHALFEKLDEHQKCLKKETYYKEAAYRTSAVGEKNMMRNYYKKAYEMTKKAEYFIRWKMGITRQQTVYLEIVFRKLVNVLRRRSNARG